MRSSIGFWSRSFGAIVACFVLAPIACSDGMHSSNPQIRTGQSGGGGAAAMRNANPAGNNDDSSPGSNGGGPSDQGGGGSGMDAGDSATSIFSIDRPNVVRRSNIVLSK